MKRLKRCSICHKRIWWWQAIWGTTFHFKCASRIVLLQVDISGEMLKQAITLRHVREDREDREDRVGRVIAIGEVVRDAIKEKYDREIGVAARK